jgi:hypothetical protein
MQNLILRRRIRDIAAVAVEALTKSSEHNNKAYGMCYSLLFAFHNDHKLPYYKLFSQIYEPKTHRTVGITIAISRL